MKDEISSIQSEMDSIKRDVADAMKLIQLQTSAMLRQVAQMEAEELQQQMHDHEQQEQQEEQ